MDRVYVEGLEIETLIGVYDFERDARQALILDISVQYDCKPAGLNDDITLALDYDRLSKRIREWALEQTFELIETFAEQLCGLLFQEFGLKFIDLKINKPAAVSDCTAVGIHIIRTFEAEH